MRLDKPLVAGMYTLLGAYIAASPGQLWSARTFTAATVVGLITAFGLVINDYCDVPEDSIGKPQRPIPSGRVSRRLAGSFACSLAFAAIVISASIDHVSLLFAIIMTALSAAYSFRFKDTVVLGNATVAILVSSVLVYGALAAGNVTVPVWIAVAVTFPYILAQEALFNLEDESCDRLAGLHTTATQLGVTGTVLLVRVLLVGTIVIASLPWLLGIASSAYLASLVACILAPIALILLLLQQPVTPAAVSKAVKLSRLSWVTSFLPLALLK